MIKYYSAKFAFEYRKRYPNCYQAFDILRNGKFVTFNSKVETAFSEERWQDALELLATRPGELARKLDFLLRNSDNSVIVDRFGEVAARVATPVLLQLISHFEWRNDQDHDKLRVFFPKGSVAKAYALVNQLSSINESSCLEIVEICERVLRDRFAQLPSLGKIYVESQLQNFPIPFSQRSASKSLRQLTRGSRLPIPAGDTLRFFLWWKEGEINDKHTGRVDLDLSAVMYDDNWNYVEHIAYTNLKSAKYQAVHSGDITSAPDGASEFIDLDLPSILKYGGRYIVASVLSFSRQPFLHLPECFMGWMIRQTANSGAIYDPRTVKDKVDLTADTTISIPAIFRSQAKKSRNRPKGLQNHEGFSVHECLW